LLPSAKFTGELQRVREERLVTDYKFTLMYYQMKLFAFGITAVQISRGFESRSLKTSGFWAVFDWF
jgi:hypothetical protein